ncbi:maintenance of telomere capping protein 1 [Gymnopilus junonius]|uniref:Maintenance of telomere capping protein 1 n=1 Tax=Gymnopilus junonius TaxID=109634 RepID=A0A9P5NHD6_GYMJU|nr:maintenance of telomere capping protein 1 [Gymnopilus junonius]
MASKKSKQEEALKFLDDLDSFAPPVETNNVQVGPPAPGATNEGEAAEVLAFLDEITQKSTEPTRAATAHISRSGTPTLRKSTERVRLGGGPSLVPSASASSSTSSLSRTLSPDGQKTKEKVEAQSVPSSQSQIQSSYGGWGWGSVGSVWSSASAALEKAKSAVDEQVKHLPKNEQARKWGEGVIEYAKTAQLDKLGQDFKRVGLSTLTDILNVVAPPISEHEVIQVWLSHDMQGYEGIESLSYRALARILEQVEGGDLIVNRGNESRPKEGSQGRDLNTVDSYETALKVSQVNIEDVIKRNSEATLTTKNPNTATTYSHVYLRIQPYFSLFTQPSSSSESSKEASQYLQFLIYLYDPEHKLTHTTVTQAVPSIWLSFWDEYDWVEDLIADALRIGVEVIGQEYVVVRMGWGSKEGTAHGSTKDTNQPEGKSEGLS